MASGDYKASILCDIGYPCSYAGTDQCRGHAIYACTWKQGLPNGKISRQVRYYCGIHAQAWALRRNVTLAGTNQ